MHVDTDGSVLEITFDRPGVLNAITTETAEALADALEDASPEKYHAIVITGEGDAFSAGGDVEAMAEEPAPPTESYDEVTATFGRVVEAMLECPVPIVANVNGDAVGAGLAIVALSDIAYAAEDATFSCAFVRVGLIPDTGGTFMLPHLVGLRAAKKLAFTGEFFDAERAAELDLVNEAVPADELDDRVTETVDRLGRRPTDVIGMMKQAMHENMGRRWPEALDYENLLQVHARSSESHEEGVSAFLEGRDPEFNE
ncbi:enoyl-CoA hydratase/isomerase family protein [Natronobacterium gregoryi]|uniref:Enoyl-CoA hydratase n=2 Tax=Natronobacterium gregoryi TaxID=44930 RepID=L0ACB8_NATGS|nr:enoyl-CoA hydratase-related protein [Natronobacterium gregoryi]AFZ71543.1 enoyl-CoA hydratase/carnithine racemase [Natronobacterium gregoryi SP2]ELY66600.1 enoyl-CoA hydratase/isomerase [Natronobacterium gregoryi SP2]PLK21313.1 enoyl-CoA hydratase [Natronobacterium gregoryi SP2]SFI82321.1 short chain enoyl-CoA hydratase /Enoyl-CoA hydratase [Natronobacterium gregoryi]